MKKYIVFLLLLISSQSYCQWMDVGGGIQNTNNPYAIVICMEVYNDKLWVYGGFNVAGSDSGLLSIATWDGNDWEGVFPGNDDQHDVRCFGFYNDNKLYIGGGFIPTVNFTTGNGIARWNGFSWEKFTYGIPAAGVPTIYNLCTFHNKLYAAGQFHQICDTLSNIITVKDIASWDGASWDNVAGGPGSQDINVLTVYNDELIAGGFIGNSGKYGLVARWNDTSWRALGRYGLDGGPGSVTAFAVDTLRNLLYVAGWFFYADRQYGRGIVQWDGRRWSFIYHTMYSCGWQNLCMYHNDLYISGIDPMVLPNGDTIAGVMKWNGAQWEGAGGRLTCFNPQSGSPGVFSVYHDTLYIGGNIDYLNDTIELNEIARLYTPPDTSCQNLLGNYNHIWAQDTTYFCDSIAVNFDNNTLYYADSWLWDFGDGTSDTLPDPLHVYDSAGIYPVSLITSYNNCIDTTYDTVAAWPCDSLKIWITGHPDTMLMDYIGTWYGAEPTFIVNANSTTTGFYYYWDTGNGYQDSGFYVSQFSYMNPFYWRYDDSGTYIITLVVKQDCCMDTIYDTLVVIDPSAGIEELSVSAEFLGQNIPNPFNNTTIIPYYVPHGTKGSIFITDINGALVEKYDLQEGNNRLEISMQRYRSGVYFYSIKINGQVKQTRKMVLER